jgi:hypothetical protein
MPLAHMPDGWQLRQQDRCAASRADDGQEQALTPERIEAVAWLRIVRGIDAHAAKKKGSALRFPPSIYKAQGGLRQDPLQDAASPDCRHGRTPE